MLRHIRRCSLFSFSLWFSPTRAHRRFFSLSSSLPPLLVCLGAPLDTTTTLIELAVSSSTPSCSFFILPCTKTPYRRGPRHAGHGATMGHRLNMWPMLLFMPYLVCAFTLIVLWFWFGRVWPDSPFRCSAAVLVAGGNGTTIAVIPVRGKKTPLPSPQCNRSTRWWWARPTAPPTMAHKRAVHCTNSSPPCGDDIIADVITGAFSC